MEQNTSTGAQPPEKGSTGAMISIIVIVFVLVFGAFYSLKKVPTVVETKNVQTTTPKEVLADPLVSAIGTQGTSTEIRDIQKDLNATDFSNLGAGLGDIVF